MVVTKHISLDEESFGKMKPYVEKHHGNFSAALKEIISQAGKSGLPPNSSAIDNPLFKWMLLEVNGILIPDTVLDELINPVLMDSMRKLEEHLKHRFEELEWDIDPVLKYDSDSSPSRVSLEMKGSPQKKRFAAALVSQYLVKNSLERSPLEIRSAGDFNECIRVELSRAGKKEAQRSLITHFGGMDEAIGTVKSNSAFWKAVINRHVLSNYNMITVHRNYFEDLLANSIPLGEITIENLAKKPLQEIPLKEMLPLIKEVYEISRIADRVEFDKDAIILFHNYRNTDAIEKIKKILVMLLEANGHLYDARSTANMIVLTHRPDVGMKINEIVDNLKTSDSSVDKELIMFMTFLKGLKDMPDIPLSLTALGRRIGKSLMQEYEKEKGLKIWSLENFKNAFEMINSRLHIESEWKLEGKDLQYTIKKCGITAEGNQFNTYICRTIRETFKGALNYAFGNRAALDIRKLVTHGDSLCEVVIKVQ